MTIFIDIETTTEYKELTLAPEATAVLWADKYHEKHAEPGMTPNDTYKAAGPLYPEFSKVICISASYMLQDKKIKSFSGDEKTILIDFADMMQKLVRGKDTICGHSIKFFDIPFLIKRYILHSIIVPNFINTNGLKPWETGWIIDTNEMWNVGSNFKTALAVVCNTLGIETPKDEMSGSDVYQKYWIDNDIESIVRYCEKDTIATMNVYYRIKDFI
jgi:hypothetical protein